MPYDPLCGHSWTPIEKDRHFRCEWCGAIGYQRPANPGARRLQERIYVHVCAVKGCREAAVEISPRKRCARHRRQP